MSCNVEKLEHNMAKFTIEVPVEEFDKAVESAYQKNKNKISMPGFRKGKVSRQMMEKMYGKTVFYDDAADMVIRKEYAKAYDEFDGEIVSAPTVDVVQIEADKPFIFTATVALKPDVTLGEYKGVTIDKIDVEVSDEEINAQIDREREAQARQVSVERPVKDGDLVVLDFEGSVDGVPFDGGKDENYNLVIGSGKFIPGFEDQLIGKKIDEECDVNVTFPENYQEKSLAGKAAVFKCLIHEIKEKQLPELDKDFAEDAGFDSVDEYKADVKNKLVSRKEKASKDAKEKAVLQAVIDNATMDIPDAMVETRQRQMVDDFARQLSMQRLTLEQYLQYTGETRQDLMDKYKDNALKTITSRLVLEAVANAENIEVSDDEFQDEFKEIVETYDMDLEDAKEMLRPDDEKGIKDDIRIKKALKLIVSNAVEK